MISCLEERTLLSTFTVTNDLNQGDGSLRWAITQANENGGPDTIDFSPRVCDDSQIRVDSPLPLLKDASRTTIAGPGEAHLSISGQHKSDIFHVYGDAQVTISGLGLCEGRATIGGAIYNTGSLDLVKCSLFDNVASDGPGVGSGGAIYNTGSVDLSDCVLAQNTARQEGGAIENSDEGAVALSGCRISENKVEDQSGAGIFNSSGTIDASQCDFRNNNAYNHGGGIYSAFGTVTLNGCSVANNKAEDGGGIYNDTHSQLIMVDSVLQKNTATAGTYLARGAGLATWGNATLTNCTIDHNIADNSGGGIYQNDGTTAINNCTITANVGTDGAGILNSGGTINLTNAIISHNTGRTAWYQPAAKGGGLWTSGGAANGMNTRITSNTSDVTEYDNLYGTLDGQGNVIGDGA